MKEESRNVFVIGMLQYMKKDLNTRQRSSTHLSSHLTKVPNPPCVCKSLSPFLLKDSGRIELYTSIALRHICCSPAKQTAHLSQPPMLGPIPTLLPTAWPETWFPLLTILPMISWPGTRGYLLSFQSKFFHHKEMKLRHGKSVIILYLSGYMKALMRLLVQKRKGRETRKKPKRNW